jgi:hypothetical protein
VLARALSKELDKRYASCTEFADALEAGLKGSVAAASRRNRWWLPIGLAAAVAAGAGVYLSLGQKPAAPAAEAPARQAPPSPPLLATAPPPPVAAAQPGVVASTPPALKAAPKPPAPAEPAKRPEAPPEAAARAVPPPAAPARKEEPAEPQYAGPSSGELLWTGSLDAGAELQIAAGTASTGSLSGQALPPARVALEITPPVVEVTVPPGRGNGWKAVLKNSSGRRQNLLMIRWAVREEAK